MATATKKSHAVSPARGRDPGPRSFISAFLRAVDAVYRFLASLKLAVISLSTLAAVLAYATFFNSWYGTTAVNEWIYRTKGFEILLAFLGANILCAALIRYPWKKRQTGFVITHAGLLVLLAGSWYSLMTGDEGQVAFLEGESKDDMVRNDHAIIRVRQVDPHQPGEVLHEWELPFRPGPFAWGPGQPRPRTIFAGLLPFSGAGATKPREVLTRPNDPFQLAVKAFIPASISTVRHEAESSGVPMVKIRPMMKAPEMPRARDVFPLESDRWFVSDRRLFRIVKSEGPAQFAFLFVDRPELVDDFLNPPADPSEHGVARIRYHDAADKPATYDWRLDGHTGKTLTLPDSDLTVKFLDVVAFPAAEAGLSETLGESAIPIAQFEVSKAGAPAVKHFALAMMPMFPNVIPNEEAQKSGVPPKPLVAINYYRPPTLDPKTNGRFGLVEVLGTPEGSLYYRVFGRGENGQTVGQIRDKGVVKKGAEIPAFGGGKIPMRISFSVDDYLPAGREKAICETIVLPRGQMDNGIPAGLVELTVNDPDHKGSELTKELYVRRSASLEPNWETVVIPNGSVYKVAYDVEHAPLGFDLKLIDFQRDFDPGTEQASRFASKVRLTDREMGLEEKPYTISMNEPLTHRGYTFYQSSYIREEDPVTHQETGRVQSVLQVGKSPGRRVIYTGCILICLGAFVQFYMRAGIFSDGGKRERERSAARAARKNGKPVDPILPSRVDVDEAL
jgi:hypothetical protein